MNVEQRKLYVFRNGTLHRCIYDRPQAQFVAMHGGQVSTMTSPGVLDSMIIRQATDDDIMNAVRFEEKLINDYHHGILKCNERINGLYAHLEQNNGY